MNTQKSSQNKKQLLSGRALAFMIWGKTSLPIETSWSETISESGNNVDWGVLRGEIEMLTKYSFS